MAYQFEEIINKYRGIKDDGAAAVAGNSIKVFEGFPSFLSQRINVSLFPDKKSRTELNWRVLKPLSEAEDRLSLTCIHAGQNYPMHVTLQEGQPIESGIDHSQMIWHFSNFVKEDISYLLCLNIEFNRLLLDKGGVVILAATSIPKLIITARRELVELLNQPAFKVLSLDNILHSTLSRITGLPDSNEKKTRTLRGFSDEVDRIDRVLQETPVVLKVGEIYAGSALSLLTMTN